MRSTFKRLLQPALRVVRRKQVRAWLKSACSVQLHVEKHNAWMPLDALAQLFTREKKGQSKTQALRKAELRFSAVGEAQLELCNVEEFSIFKPPPEWLRLRFTATRGTAHARVYCTHGHSNLLRADLGDVQELVLGELSVQEFTPQLHVQEVSVALALDLTVLDLHKAFPAATHLWLYSVNPEGWEVLYDKVTFHHATYLSDFVYHDGLTEAQNRDKVKYMLALQAIYAAQRCKVPLLELQEKLIEKGLV